MIEWRVDLLVNCYTRIERMELNRLEMAMLDSSGIQLDSYLDDTSTAQIMADIKELRTKAASTTDAGLLRMQIQEVLDRT